MICTKQAITCCVCNITVRTGNTILKGPVQPFTHHFHRNCQNNFHHVLHDQSSHLLPVRQHPGDQPERLAGHDHMITVVPGFPAQTSSTPCQCCTSSAYRLEISIVQSNPMGHMLYVLLQSRLVRGRQDRSNPDLEMNFLSSPTILWSSLTWTAFTDVWKC